MRRLRAELATREEALAEAAKQLEHEREQVDELERQLIFQARPRLFLQPCRTLLVTSDTTQSLAHPQTRTPLQALLDTTRSIQYLQQTMARKPAEQLRPSVGSTYCPWCEFPKSHQNVQLCDAVWRAGDGLGRASARGGFSGAGPAGRDGDGRGGGISPY